MHASCYRGQVDGPERVVTAGGQGLQEVDTAATEATGPPKKENPAENVAELDNKNLVDRLRSFFLFPFLPYY